MRSVSFQQTIGAVTHDIPLIWPRTSFGVLPSTSPLDDFLLLPRTSNMLNSSATYDGPPLPSYTLTPRPDLIPQIPDKVLLLVLPVVAYWAVSLLFHWIDTKDYFSQYRLHTPAEVLARNHVTRWDVFRDVILQQIIQTAFGLLLGATEPEDMVGKEDYDVAIWARRIRIAQRSIPSLLALVGVDSVGLAKNVATAHPMIAGFLSGGNYSTLTQLVDLPEYPQAVVPAFAGWELLAASGIYYCLIPFFQFTIGIIAIDTWEYFLHRGMHMNKWLYSIASPTLVKTSANPSSYTPLPPPPPLRPLRIRCPLQPPPRRIPA